MVVWIKNEVADFIQLTIYRKIQLIKQYNNYKYFRSCITHPGISMNYLITMVIVEYLDCTCVQSNIISLKLTEGEKY